MRGRGSWRIPAWSPTRVLNGAVLVGGPAVLATSLTGSPMGTLVGMVFVVWVAVLVGVVVARAPWVLRGVWGVCPGCGLPLDALGNPGVSEFSGAVCVSHGRLSLS